MKKILFTAAAFLMGSSLSFALDIQKVSTHERGPLQLRASKTKVSLNPATYTIITNTPNGEMLKNMSWTSEGCYPNGSGGIAWVTISGYAPQIVVNGNKMYIYAPITQLAETAAAWIEGTISEDGQKVTFPTPQAYMLNGFDVLYATRCNADGTPDPANLDLVFGYENGHLIQEDGGVLLLTNLEGGFYGYGEKNIVIEKINDTTVSLPEGVTPESYLLEFKKGDTLNRQTALVAFDGNDVYFSDPLGIEDSWFKGVREGNTITVSTPQYMGSEVGFPMYVTKGRELRSTQIDQMTGQPYEVIDYQVIPNADITFTIDETTGVISSSELLLMNSGKEDRGNAYSAVNHPVYTPWTAETAVPADPSISYYIDLNDYIEYGLQGCMLAFEVPSYGTNGEFIPQENLYYQICFDGKPLEFYGTTMIPYYGQFTDYETMESIQLSTEDYDSHNMQLPYNPQKSVSIQSFYAFDGEPISSKLVEYEIMDGELIEAGVDSMLVDREMAGVEYYDLNGIRIQPSKGSGLVIRKTVFTDGSLKCEKVIL